MSGFHMCPFRCSGHAPAVSPQKGTCLFIVHRQQWVRNGTLFGNCSVYNISIPPHTIPCLCAYPALKMSLLHTHNHNPTPTRSHNITSMPHISFTVMKRQPNVCMMM